MPSPITLNLYDPETQEAKEPPYTANFIPWKMLKKAIRLNKALAKKQVEDYEESDIDEISNFVIGVFGKDLTIEMLDEGSDLMEMMTVVQTIVARARGLMDPTLPLKA